MSQSDYYINEFRTKLEKEQLDAHEQLKKCDELRDTICKNISKRSLILNKLDELQND